MKVMKFGGSILRSAEDIKRAAGIVRNEDDERVVVISALGGVTDEIETFLDGLDRGKGSPADAAESLRRRHANILSELVNSRTLADEIRGRVNSQIERWERVAFGVLYTEELTPRSRDFLMSFGERLSVILFEGALKDHNVPAQAMEMDRLGCITDGEYGCATVDMESTEKQLPQAIQPVVKGGEVPVITGFFGSDERGHTTVFGRGGADYSAAVTANALDAEVLELWKDVEGFYSADPTLVPSARHMSRLSYDEAAEMAYFGARILHPMAIWPLSEKNIPLWVGDIGHADRSRGTLVTSETTRNGQVIKCVTSSKDIGILKIQGAGVGHTPGVLSRFVSELSHAGINIKSVITSQTSIAILLDRNDLQRAHELLKRLPTKVVERLMPLPGVAIIGVVGDGLNNTKGVAGKIFSAVAGKGINVEMISSGASETAYYFIVNESEVERAVVTIHDDLFGP